MESIKSGAATALLDAFGSEAVRESSCFASKVFEPHVSFAARKRKHALAGAVRRFAVEKQTHPLLETGDMFGGIENQQLSTRVSTVC